MLIRLAALIVALAFFCTPVSAQEPNQSFATFEAELWPDAQVKGITRANFDIAMKGVTPDPRVIAATKRQPEYGKPVGDSVKVIPSNPRLPTAPWTAREG